MKNVTEDAIGEIFAELAKQGFDHQKSGLECFARDGRLYTRFLRRYVEELEAWDIDSAYKSAFEANVSAARFECCDSIERLATSPDSSRKFDVISIDNPLGCYGPERRYCEHFEAIGSLACRLEPRAAIIFNVVRKPFNLHRDPQWQERRATFYGIDSTEDISISFLEDFYTALLERQHLKVERIFSRCREFNEQEDYFYFMTALVGKIC